VRVVLDRESATYSVAVDGVVKISGLPATTSNASEVFVGSDNNLFAGTGGGTTVFADDLRVFEAGSGDCISTLADGLVNVGGLALDESNIYWVESPFPGNIVKRIPKTGGTPTVVAGTPTFGCCATDIEVDASSVYWSSTFGYGGGYVWKAEKGGVDGPVTELTGANQPADIAVDSAFVYWAEDNGGPDWTQGVRRVPSGGGSIETLTTTGFPLSVLLVDGSVYFSYQLVMSSQSRIGVVPKGGGGVTDVAETGSRASAMVSDGTHIYWTEFDAGAVKRMPIGGGAVTTLASGLQQPWRIAVDSTRVYWVEWANGVAGAGAVRSVGKTGGVPMPLAIASGPNGIVADGENVYWSEWGPEGSNGAIRKIPRP
jgi:hypothetical protein